MMEEEDIEKMYSDMTKNYVENILELYPKHLEEMYISGMSILNLDDILNKSLDLDKE